MYAWAGVITPGVLALSTKIETEEQKTLTDTRLFAGTEIDKNDWVTASTSKNDTAAQFLVIPVHQMTRILVIRKGTASDWHQEMNPNKNCLWIMLWKNRSSLPIDFFVMHNRILCPLLGLPQASSPSPGPSGVDCVARWKKTGPEIGKDSLMWTPAVRPLWAMKYSGEHMRISLSLSRVLLPFEIPSTIPRQLMWKTHWILFVGLALKGWHYRALSVSQALLSCWREKVT